jgi:hypothetical protein
MSRSVVHVPVLAAMKNSAMAMVTKAVLAMTMIEAHWQRR